MSSVVVLAGGTSDERAVSLRSGAAVAAALGRKGYTVRQLDPADGLAATDFESADVVFPALHGVGGEDGSIQALLEHFGVRYVGSDVATSELCFDKWRYKQLMIENGIANPAGALVDETEFWASDLIKRPFILKPNDGGSSIDNLLVREPSATLDKSKINSWFVKYNHMLIEELIDGVEITVAVLDDKALPVIEIVPPPNGEFDYTNKYNGASQELCPPEHVSQADQNQAQDLAKRIHRLCGCRDMSRTDIIISDDTKLYVLETNTIPGLTDQSLLPKAASVAGIKMPALCDRLVKAALARS